MRSEYASEIAEAKTQYDKMFSSSSRAGAEMKAQSDDHESVVAALRAQIQGLEMDSQKQKKMMSELSDQVSEGKREAYKQTEEKEEWERAAESITEMQQRMKGVQDAHRPRPRSAPH